MSSEIAIRFSALFQLFFVFFLIAPYRKAPFTRLFQHSPLSTFSGVSIIFAKPPPFGSANFYFYFSSPEPLDFQYVARKFIPTRPGVSILSDVVTAKNLPNLHK